MKSNAHNSKVISKLQAETFVSSKSSGKDGYPYGRTGNEKTLPLAPAHVIQLQRSIGNRAVAQLFRDRAFLTAQQAVMQRKENNDSGLPAELKSGIEQLSGLSMDGTKVIFNSSKPADLNALAFAQGSEIHLGPGQEKHLPHEAWHVVQQKQGRVQPTMQMKGNTVNNDASLEIEADTMGERASRLGEQAETERADDLTVVPSKSNQPVQMIRGDLLAFLKNAWRGPEGPKANWYSQIAMILRGTKFEGKAQEVYDYYQENEHLALPAKDDNEYTNDTNSEEEINNNSEEESKSTGKGDVSIPENRPTSGGMVEGDAAIIAEMNGWGDVSGDWSCDDPSHTPKGKVYYNRSSNSYYGADNTGHVGWGFKVWSKKNKTTLSYKGNVVWDGTVWKHITRGTK
ncbi:eCIS core domain-containing protein [Paenibacillus aestuarii]|uniref:DUF4157 domain-containing protein n=1 Tax=Paenibacillus aestuarii TaxID=516965 RepID=A0ABW0KGW9_9BACL|nr:DUF4157 domain-containing protein [Paenibacillus aestuarii]